MHEHLRFLIDESSFEDTTDPLENAFELLVTRIAGARRHGVGKFSLVWETLVRGRLLIDWLFDRELAIDPDVARALQIALDRSPDWDEHESVEGIPTEVLLEQGERTAYSLAAAAALTQRGRAMGVISPVAACIGPRKIGLNIGPAGRQYVSVHFVGDESSQLTFFRDLAEVENLGEAEYFENARRAFPGIVFHRERVRFSAFDEEYRTIRAKVSLHLAVLNDHASAIFADVADPRDIASMFRSHGVDASGESGNTKANTDAMRQRKAVIGGRSVMLDWHTKIRPHLDRIYFNVSSGLVVVGVFHKHLD